MKSGVMRRACALLLCFLVLAVPFGTVAWPSQTVYAAQAVQPQVVVSQVRGFTGQRVTIAVDALNVSGVAGAQFILRFNPNVLRLVEGSITSSIVGSHVVVNYSRAAQGSVSVAIAAPHGVAQSSFTICEIAFDIVGPPNHATEIQLTALGRGVLIGENDAVLPVAIVSGLVGSAVGDINRDHAITVADAVTLLRHVVGIAPLDPLAIIAAEVSGDGNVDVGDAVLILRLVVGLIAEFPVAPIMQPLPRVASGTLTLGSTADPVMLNPILSTDTASSNIHGRTNLGLVRTDEQNMISPALAESWQWLPETLTYRFHLFHNVLWHDGVPFTAHDVKFTYDTIMHADYDGPRKPVTSAISEIVVLDDHTVDFRLMSPAAAFLFSNSGIGVIPRHIFADVPVREMRAHSFSRHPIGTGPYRFVRWETGLVELVANPHFHLEGPYIARVIVRTFADLNVMQAAFEAGEIDWFGGVPLGHIDRLQREMAGRAYFVERPNHGYDYISLNLTNPILSDLRVRHALKYALDRQQMLNTAVVRGQVVHGHQIPTSWAHNPNLYTYAHNVEKAKALLDQAGWLVPEGSSDGVRAKDGQRLSLRIMTNAGNPIRMQIIHMAESYWEKIGVEVNPEIIEWSVMLDRFSRADYDMTIIGWSLGLDPDPFSMFHSSQADMNANGVIEGFNRGQFRNAEVDRLIEQGRITKDVAERRRIYQEVDVILNAELPYIWLFQRSVMNAISNRLQGVVWSPTWAIFPERWYVVD